MTRTPKHKQPKTDKPLLRHRLAQVGLAALLGLLLAALVGIWEYGKNESHIARLRQNAGSADHSPDLTPGAKNVGGSFTMTNQDGRQVTNADFLGKYMLIYFGYTYCPDMCPTGLQSMAHALDQLGDDAKQIAPIFVTIDPARDTPAKLKEYDASFHPGIIGLSGTPAQTAEIAKAYQVYYARGEDVEDDEYIMEHSSLIYLMGPRGEFITTFPEEVDPNAIVAALKQQGVKAGP